MTVDPLLARRYSFLLASSVFVSFSRSKAVTGESVVLQGCKIAPISEHVRAEKRKM